MPTTEPSVSDVDPSSTPDVVIVASGDLRHAANQLGWPAQVELERGIEAALGALGRSSRRAHEFDSSLGHGFISSQRMGMEVFTTIDPEAPLIVAEAVWQYSHHVLAGLEHHRGPILTVANWSGQWPGLVGLLNLNASLTKMGREYSTLWTEDYRDEFFVSGLRTWLDSGQVDHPQPHVRDYVPKEFRDERELGSLLAGELKRDKVILGVFDEGCMGMYNAIFDDRLLGPMGIYKERLSQSALLAEMADVDDDTVARLFDEIVARGITFEFGTDDVTDLTRQQVDSQLRMYVAAARIADDFGCDAIGIQYQQGLARMCPASDLAEGLLNERDRPVVTSRDGSRLLFEGQPVPHFNEVDEGAAVDIVVTNRVWNRLGFDPSTTLHDIRWGEPLDVDGREEFVWVMEISGAVPPSHIRGGYEGVVSRRQPPMYFPLGGATIGGMGKAGSVVWSRVFVMDDALHADIGRATAIEVDDAEHERRSAATTPQWPIMHAVLHGVDRDQLMSRHRANHLNVAYAPSDPDADRALAAKAAMFSAMGITVHLCGDVTV